MEGNRKFSQRFRMAALLLSILLHILGFFSWSWLQGVIQPVLPAQTPPSLQPEYERITYELVNTPSNLPDLLPAEETELVPDRNSRAADAHADNSLAEGLPYQEGYTEAKNYPQEKELSPQEEIAENQKKLEDQETGFLAAFQKQQQQKKEQFEEPAFKNLDSSVIDFGGFSFNTYNWDFAPYLLNMQQRIRSNMVLPYAFTNLGAISGDILVRFSVLPDGIVNKLEILQSNAHYSLEQSSVNAVENSSAFAPLPRDFPEDKLIVTAKFSFTILKN